MSNQQFILVGLRGSERYGLELVEEIKELTGRALSLGSLYVTLHRMEAAGLVRSRWGDEKAEERRGARRRYYRLTGAGRTAYEEMRRVIGVAEPALAAGR